MVYLECFYNVIDVLIFIFEDFKLFFSFFFLKVIDIFIFDIGIVKIVEKSLNLEMFIVGEYCFNFYNVYGGFIFIIVEIC